MPHLTIDYSPNLEDQIDMQAFCDHMRRAMIEIETLPMAGIRVRAIRADYFSIADGDKKHGFIDIALRLRGGRSPTVKKAATTEIFTAATTFLAPVLATTSIAISFEMRDIDPDLSPKTSTIREHLEFQKQ